MKPLYLIAEIHPHPEKLQAAKAAYLELREATLQEAGCICYDLVSNSDELWFMLEKWESQGAWDNHMKTPHVARISELEPSLTYKQTKLTLLRNIV